MLHRTLLQDVLDTPRDAIAYHLSKELAQIFPGKYLLETSDCSFDVTQFSLEGLCELNPKAEFHSQNQTQWDGMSRREYISPYNGWYTIDWEDRRFELVSCGWQGQHCREQWSVLVADSQEIAGQFFRTVCNWCSEAHGEVLVFSAGQWQKSKELYSSIQGARFTNLVLPSGMAQQIEGDVKSFFNSKETYDHYKIPWKRGMLFLGPPGNGKTHAVKAIVNSQEHPCLYVKSFKADYLGDHSNIASVFSHAREVAPCILIFEDLDSLVDGGNRAFFLNELDGFASNAGILTLATTNFPERLDPSILERPSRFDRKFTFDLPGLQERMIYLSSFSSALELPLQLSQADINKLANATEGFSFAYLKELFLSGMMQWMQDPEKHSMGSLMHEKCAVLLSQMSSEPTMEAVDGEDNPVHQYPFRKFPRRWR